MSTFQFKYFEIHQGNTPLKVGTDAMLLGALASIQGKNCLDIGTGTGVLALMMAQKYPELKITAIESNAKACIDAKKNFQLNQLGKNIQLIQGDFFEWSPDLKFDAVISNPPFYSTENFSSDDGLSMAKHFSGSQIESFVKKCAELMSESALLLIITAKVHDDVWSQAFEKNNLYVQKETEIWNYSEGKPTRIIRHLGFEKVIFEKDRFYVRKKDGDYSDMYKVLTADFHKKKL